MKKRIISAIILLAIFVPLIMLGGNYFAALMLVVGIAGLYELLNLKHEQKEIPLLLKLLAYLITAFLILNNLGNSDLSLVLSYKAITLLVFSFMIPILVIDNSKKYNIEDALYLIGSVLFIGLSFNLVILIRNYSLEYLVYFFIITIMTDTFAYISGCLVGRHKLAEKISPNKSIEGLIGGTIMGVFIAVMYYLEMIDANIDMSYLLIVTVSLSLIGQLGDLIFSSIKRYYKKKDFSNLIPGHGGVLDRFDSIIFVVLAAVIFLSII